LAFFCVASGPAPEREEAGALIERGDRHFDAGRYKLAIRSYEGALAKRPDPRVLVNLAEAQWRIGHWGAALINFRKLIDQGEARPGSKMHRDIAARIDEIQEKSARVVFGGEIAEAEIVLDEIAVRPKPGDPVLLAPGRHQVIARARGYAPTAATIHLEEGATLKIPLALERVREPEPPVIIEELVDGPELPEPPGDSILETWWFWAIVGSVVTGATVGSILLGSDPEPPHGELGTSRFSTWQGGQR
jgi:hypothetical protein